jgi:hypothetical protein
MKRVIVEKPSNRTERYEVAIAEMGGRKFLDIRTFYSKDGEWLPTKKGAMIPVEISGEVYRAIRKVGKEYFDLVPPPGKEQEAEDKATEKVMKKKKKKQVAEEKPSGVKRKKSKEVEEEPSSIKRKKKDANEDDDLEVKAKKKKSKKQKAEAAAIEFSPDGKKIKKKKKDKDSKKASKKEEVAVRSKRPH